MTKSTTTTHPAPGSTPGSTPGNTPGPAPALGPAPRRFDLVAIDLDGTLLRSDKKLSKRVAAAVIHTARQGVHIVLASARPPRSMREIYDLLQLDTLQINYNGALIHDVPKARHIFHQPLDADLVRKIIKHARRIAAKVVVSVEILDKWYTDHFDDNFPTETSLKFSPDFVGPLKAFWHVPATKLMFHARPDVIQKLRKSITAKFAGKINTAISDTHLMQIIHPTVDKSHALAQVAANYNVTQNRVLAIGDAPNDAGMLRWAGMGVAVENAWPAARAAADDIAPSNDNEGVLHALEKHVLTT